MDGSDEDQRLEHQRNPPKNISVNELTAKTGVLVFKLDLDTFEQTGTYEKLRL